MRNKSKFVNVIFPHMKIVLRRFVLFSTNYFQKSKVKVLRTLNIIYMCLVEEKDGEIIGLFEYCGIITSVDYR